MIALTSRLFWLFLLAMLPVVFDPGAVDAFGPVKQDVFMMTGLALALLTAGRLVRSGWTGAASRLAGSPAAWPLLLTLALAGLALAGRADRSVAVLDLLTAPVATGLAALLVADDSWRPGWKAPAVYGTAVTGCALYGLAQFAGGDPWVWQRGFAGHAPISTFGNPLFFADGLLMGLAILVVASLAGPVRWRGLAYAACWPVAVVMPLTQARGAWLGAAVALGLAWWWGRREAVPGALRRAAPGFALIGAIVLGETVVLSRPGPLNPHGLDLVTHALGAVSPAREDHRGRWLMWRAAAEMATGAPLLGWGPGAVRERYPVALVRLRSRPEFADLPPHTTGHAHQDVLQYLAERGVVGLGLAAWLGVVLFRMRRQASGSSRTAVLAGLGGWLTDGLVNGPAHLPPSSLLLWLFVGLAAREEATASVERATTPCLSRGVAVAFAAAGGLAVVTALPFARDLLGEGYLQAASFAMDGRRADLAFPLALRAEALGIEDRRQHQAAGSAAFALGEFTLAADEFRQDAAANPGLVSGWHNLGLAELRAGRRREALAALHRAEAVDPGDAEAESLIEDAGRVNEGPSIDRPRNHR